MSFAPVLALLQSSLLLLQVLQSPAPLPQDIQDDIRQLVVQTIVQANVVLVSASTTAAALQATSTREVTSIAPFVDSLAGIVNGYACPGDTALYNDGYFGFKCQTLGTSTPESVSALPCILGESELCQNIASSSYLSAFNALGQILTTPITIPYAATSTAL